MSAASTEDMVKIQSELTFLEQFNAQARGKLKAARRKLRKVRESSDRKERHKRELLLRRTETVEKLRIANQEHEMLSKRINGLRSELRNEKHAELVESCQAMVQQYVEEIRREMSEGIGIGAVADKARNLRHLALVDETDADFEAGEARLTLGKLGAHGGSPAAFGADAADFDPRDRGAARHGIEAHETGALDKGGSSGGAGSSSSSIGKRAARRRQRQRRRNRALGMKDSDDEGSDGSTDSAADGMSGSGSDGSGNDDDYDDEGDSDSSDGEDPSGGAEAASAGAGRRRARGGGDGKVDEVAEELEANNRWVKSRRTQLLHIRGADKNALAAEGKEGGAGSSRGGGGGGRSSGQFAVDVVYTENTGFSYTCQLAVLRSFTFEHLVAEACAHWGLAPEYTFLEDPETGAIWPASAVVEVELPLETSVPTLNLVFREHMDIADLVLQAGGGGRGGGGGGGGGDQADSLGIAVKEDGGGGGGSSGGRAGGRRAGGRVGVGDGESKYGGGVDGSKDPEDDFDAAGVHDPSVYHPYHLRQVHRREQARLASAQKERINPSHFVVRCSWVTRDFLVFALWFVLINLSVAGKRNISNQFWLTQAFEKPLVEQEFVSAQYDSVPKLNADGAVPLSSAQTANVASDSASSAAASSSSSASSPYDSYRWWQQVAFRDIHDAQQWWHWVEGPLQDLLFGAANSTTHTPGYLREGSTQLLGALRFRQLRVKANRGCTISYLAKDLYSKCYPDFRESYQDTTQFTASEDSTGFTWSSGSDGDNNGQSTSLSGAYTTYPGGGFVLDVPYSKGRKGYAAQVKRLRQGNWLDLQTRAVVVELTAFNPTHNLYSSTHFILEQSASGLWTTSSQSWVAALDVCLACDAYAAVDVLLYLVTAWIVFAEALQLAHACSARDGLRTYCCQNTWSVQYCVTLAFFFASVVCRAVYVAEAQTVLELLWQTVDSQEYYDITDKLRLCDAADTLEAVTILFAAFRIFRYLQYNRRMRQFTRVFVLAGMEIVFFSFMFAFTFFGFVLLGHNIYGAHLQEWSTIVNTFRTLIKMMVGNFDYEAMRQVDQVRVCVCLLGVIVGLCVCG